MAAYTTQGIALQISTDGGTTYNDLALLTSAEIQTESQNISIMTIDSNVTTKLAGVMNSTVNFSGFLDRSSTPCDTLNAALEGTSLQTSYMYQLVDVDTGTTTYSFSGPLASITKSYSVNEAVVFSGTIDVSGAITTA